MRACVVCAAAAAAAAAAALASQEEIGELSGRAAVARKKWGVLGAYRDSVRPRGAAIVALEGWWQGMKEEHHVLSFFYAEVRPSRDVRAMSSP